MNPLFRTLLVVAVASAAVTGEVTALKAQPAPTDASSDNNSSLPPNITPDSPTAQVIKLTQAGTDVNVINAYVANSGSAFNLDADTVVSLKDAGVPTDVINAMMNHDKNFNTAPTTAATAPPAPEPAPAPQTVPMPQTPAPTVYAPTPDNAVPGDVTGNPAPPDVAPPAVQVDQQYFNTALSPYGSWVQVDGYGTCWRPTVVLYDGGWNPYCDRGNWVYTDCGWYWNSDYSWGVTFHYGRWFRHPRLGWCWSPDTVWAPSWVVWRSGDNCCGWAPLPPFAVCGPGGGFFYRGVSVGVDFDFGLSANCFIFVSPERFCDRHPRSFCFDHTRVTQVFGHTSVINHFDVHGHTLVNNGIAVSTISAHAHHDIEPVKVGSLPNVRREGWQGAVTPHTVAARDYSSSQNNPFNGYNHNHGGNPTVNHSENNVTVTPPINHGANQNNNQFNNYNNNYSHHSQSPTPQNTAPGYNNYQNNNSGQPHGVQAPTTPAPNQFHHFTTPPVQQPPVQQRAQQNDYHSYNGTYNQHSYNSGNGQSSSQGQGQSQGYGQGRSQSSGYSQGQNQGQSQGQVHGTGHN